MGYAQWAARGPKWREHRNAPPRSVGSMKGELGDGVLAELQRKEMKCTEARVKSEGMPGGREQHVQRSCCRNGNTHGNCRKQTSLGE